MKMDMPLLPSSSSRSPEELMKELANDTARFELRSEESIQRSPFASISLGRRQRPNSCFARISSIQQKLPSSTRKEQDYRVHKVRGDGRCMFRALALGMSINDGIDLNPREETIQADELRISVEEAICFDKREQQKYKEALIAIKIEEPVNRYCGRIKHPDFWGGEPELLILSRMYEQPIIVYIPEHEAKSSSSLWNTGYVPIAEYGSEYLKSRKDQEACKPVRLLYSDGNHYDLLV